MLQPRRRLGTGLSGLGIFLPLILAPLLASCGPRSPSTVHDPSTVKDIYRNDAETRHEATDDEIGWTVFVIRQSGNTLSFCTGVTVISVARSGFLHRLRKSPARARVWLYSGK